MPTLTAWEPTLLDRELNPASPWVLVRANCGHEQFYVERKRIKRFMTARIAADFITQKKLNVELDNEFDGVIIQTVEDS